MIVRIALIVHGFPPAARGGTELYVEALSRAFAAGGHEVLVVAREADRRLREYAVRTETRAGLQIVFVNNTFSRCASFVDSYRNPRVGRAVREIIAEFSPEIVHIHHLTCLSTEIPAEVSGLGVPAVMTLHDYWLMCHRGQLLDRGYRLCPGPGDRGCASCIGSSAASGVAMYAAARGVRALGRVAPELSRRVTVAGRAALARFARENHPAELSLARLAHMREAASHIARFLAPSEYVRRSFIDFGIPPQRIERHEQGIDVGRFQRSVPRPGPVRIGYFGSLVVSKGAEVLLEAFSQLPAGSAVLRIFGHPAPYHDDDPSSRLEALLRHRSVEHVGAVTPEEVPRALGDLDVVVVPSIWPENAPFVLREARAAGVPAIASRIGGIPEFVNDDQNGLLFEPASVVDCARALRRFIDDADLRARLSKPGTVRSLDDDVRRTLEIYSAVRAEAGCGRVNRLERPSPPERIAAVVVNYHTTDDTVLAVGSLLASDKPPGRILVVDNASQDDGAAMRAQLPPIASVIPLQRNRGFAGGVNVGITTALEEGASAVLLLNSDAVIAPDALGRLERALDTPAVGIAGAALVSRSDPSVLSSLGMSWSSRSGRMRHQAFGRPVGERHTAGTRRVDGVSGCAMLVRREVFERCGLFDEEYFFGFEDLAFCLRAAAAGIFTVCCPEAVVYHEGGRSIGAASPERLYFATRNHLKLAAEGKDRAPAKAVRTTAVLAFNLAFAIRSRDVGLVPRLSAFARGARHYFLGRFGSA